MIPCDLHHTWQRLLCLTVFLFIVGIVFVPNELDYYCKKAKRAVDKGDYARALTVGKKSTKTNDELTSWRAYALYKQGSIGDKVFTYPLSGGSEALHRLPADDKDRILCGDLMDKNLDQFARHIAQYYHDEAASLPRHYREALLLQTHLRSNPVIIYRNNVLEADYSDYQRMERQATDSIVRMNMLRGTFGTTYWYYYDYQ